MVTYTVQSYIYFFCTLDRNIKKLPVAEIFFLALNSINWHFAFIKAFNLRPIYMVLCTRDNLPSRQVTLGEFSLCYCKI